MTSVWNRNHLFLSSNPIEAVETADHHVCQCSFCPKNKKRINDLKLLLTHTKQELHDIKAHMQEMVDLNLISPYATRFYTNVFKEVRRDFQALNEHKLVSLPFNSWVELFSAASAEATKFDDFDTDKKPLNDLILGAMHRMCQFTHDDWESIQSIRKDRNSKGHPRLDDDKVMEAVERWSDHPAYSSLHKMMTYLQRKRSRQKPTKKMYARR